VCSIAALAVIDFTGLAIGLYLALALRSLVRDPKPILWNLLWNRETDWLPFLTLLLLLVKDGAFTHEYSAPSAGPPPWGLYAVTPTTVFGVLTVEPGGATRWRF